MTQLPIFYINLVSRPDRRAFMEAQFAELHLEASRIEAIDGAKVPADHLVRYGDARRAKWLTPGEIACSLSHMEAMARIVQSGASWGCILEDDVRLSASLPKFLDAFAANAPAIDLVRIEAVYRAVPMRRERAAGIAGFDLYRCFGAPNGTGGYLISAAAARAITTGQSLLGRAADDALFNAFQPLSRRFRVRLLSPALCTAEQGVSRHRLRQRSRATAQPA